MPDTADAISPEEFEGVLRTRARLLARAPVESQQAATIEVVEFMLADERYAFEAGSVHDVRVLEEPTPVPCTPAFFVGLVNARGRLVPVIDLKRLFDLPVEAPNDMHRVVLLRGEDTELGVLADAVEGSRRVPLDSIQPSLPTLTGIRGDYLRGVTADHLVILDAKAILSDPRLVVDEEVDR